MCFAEREGFEPPDPLRSTVFKTAAFDHSAISPMSNVKFVFHAKWIAKVSSFFDKTRVCRKNQYKDVEK